MKPLYSPPKEEIDVIHFEATCAVIKLYGAMSCHRLLRVRIITQEFCPCNND